ncbi:hypothetical protein [uncultured Cohaesibacter sp.]|uniref:hypothetical protein n=1 Tax=uncultured Cohaesibacter sp. TaxID=1002546 RepID=UPI0029C90431|nr:hypothetical protein [uncultured Cohaesibacter sp.]
MTLEHIASRLCWSWTEDGCRAVCCFGYYRISYVAAHGYPGGVFSVIDPDGNDLGGHFEEEDARQSAQEDFTARLGEAPFPDTLMSLVKDAWVMAQKAKNKFPQEPGNIPPHDKFAEESGELFKAIIHCAEGRDSLQHVREEMVDTIAMIFRVHEEGVKAICLPSVKGGA